MYAPRKQKYENGSIHRKLRSPMQRPRGRVNCQTRVGAPRVRDAWRKFTEIYGIPRASAARALCSYLAPFKGTVHINTSRSSSRWGKRIPVCFNIVISVASLGIVYMYKNSIWYRIFVSEFIVFDFILSLIVKVCIRQTGRSMICKKHTAGLDVITRITSCLHAAAGNSAGVSFGI